MTEAVHAQKIQMRSAAHSVVRSTSDIPRNAAIELRW